MKRLGAAFFDRRTETVAKELLGKYLTLRTKTATLSGLIVETEAYHENDPASHSYKGKTPRNAPMFGKPGHAYVYFTYGMHWCFNIVTEKDGTAGAVLIRAVEPVSGIELMKKNRKKKDVYQLTNGPAKFTQAFGITEKYNNMDLINGAIGIYDERQRMPGSIVRTNRIGISVAKDDLMRFYVRDNPFVSVK